MVPQTMNCALIADNSNLYSTTLARAIRDNTGEVYPIEGFIMASMAAFPTIAIEHLDEQKALVRIQNTGNSSYTRRFQEISYKTTYRLTLPDGQRLIYVQSISYSECFLCQDSHVSFGI